jgi:hypothetical protein
VWIDVLALALVGIFVFSGLVRGGLAAGLALVTLFGAYLAAWLLAPGLGPAAARALSLPSVFGLPAAGAAVFLAAYFGFGLVSTVVRARERRARAGDPRSAGDRARGGLLGGLRAGLLVLLVGYAALWLGALEAVTGDSPLPSVEGSAVASASRAAAATAAGALVEEGAPGARLAVRAASRPAETFGALQRILDDPRVDDLRADRRFWATVEAGDVDGALNRVSFVAVAYSSELRERFAEAGLVGPDAVGEPRAFRDEIAEALQQVAPRIRNLRQDPEIQALAQDPEVIRLLQEGDTLALLRHPGFARLVDRLVAEPPSA